MSSEKVESKGFFERAAIRLFQPSVEGVPDTGLFEIAREFSDQLSGYPEYIGLTVRGSRLLGYADADSDADLAVLYDSSHQSAFRKFVWWSQILLANRLIGIARGEKIGAKAFDVAPCLKKLEQSFIDEDSDGVLAILCEPAIGPQIALYRDRVRNKIQSVSNFESILSDIVDKLLQFETSRLYRTHESLEARGEEVTLLGADTLTEFLKQRRTLWRRRVNRILGKNIITRQS